MITWKHALKHIWTCIHFCDNVKRSRSILHFEDFISMNHMNSIWLQTEKYTIIIIITLIWNSSLTMTMRSKDLYSLDVCVGVFFLFFFSQILTNNLVHTCFVSRFIKFHSIDNIWKMAMYVTSSFISLLKCYKINQNDSIHVSKRSTDPYMDVSTESRLFSSLT